MYIKGIEKRLKIHYYIASAFPKLFLYNLFMIIPYLITVSSILWDVYTQNWHIIFYNFLCNIIFNKIFEYMGFMAIDYYNIIILERKIFKREKNENINKRKP